MGRALLGCVLSVMLLPGCQRLAEAISHKAAEPGYPTISRTATTLVLSSPIPLIVSSSSTLPASFTPSSFPTPSASPIPTSTPKSRSFPCLPQTYPAEYALVLWVSDGQTIVVDLQGRQKSVRYLGIQAPIFGAVSQPFSEEAKKQNQELVTDQVVRLLRDVSDADQFGQLLRYVLVGDVFVNYELVRRGMALALSQPPDLACQGELDAAQRLAQGDFLGMWALPTYTPTRYIILTPTPSPSLTSTLPTDTPTGTITPPTPTPTGTITPPTPTGTITPPTPTDTVAPTSNGDASPIPSPVEQ